MIRYELSPHVFAVLCTVSGTTLGCGAKHPEEIDSETGGAPDAAWVPGRYYQPVSGSYSTDEKASMNVFEDFTAQLDREWCHSNQGFSQVVRWEMIDDDTVGFSAMNAGEEFLWFGNEPFGAVRMRRTDNPSLVIVSDGPSEMGSTLGAFRRGTGCLQIVDPLLGCNGGAVVKACEAPTTG